MTCIRSSIRQAAAALFAVLLPFVVLVGSVQAQTITNVAQATWSHAGQSNSGQSNLVTLQMQAQSPQIQTFVLGTGTSLPIYDTMCGYSPQPGSGPGSGATPQTVGLTPSNVVQAGRTLFFSIDLAIANRDSAAVESVFVEITTSTGDREQLTVYESASDSGRFVGSVETRRMPPAPVQSDCRLSLVDGSTIQIDAMSNGGTPIGITAQVDVLADPFGVVFDSATGAAVSGAAVSLVDAQTGQPAQVFAEDGVSFWPSTVISGQPVTDGAGNVVQMGPGEFWFPLTNLGSYRLLVVPPAPYSAPSVVPPAQLALLTRPGGGQFVILDASYGADFQLTDPVPVQVDIPLDAPTAAVTLTKTASRAQAYPGDGVFYTLTLRNPDASRPNPNVVVTDVASQWLRLRLDSVRIDGLVAPSGTVQTSADGRTTTFSLGVLAPGAQRRITYAMTVLPDAPPGYAENRAGAVDSLGRQVSTGTSVEILRDNIAGRMTIIGRITAGACDVTEGRIGIPGVRVMMEDGSFAITDADGRYHFDGVVPGTHVVQASHMTLPEGGEFVDCTRSTRSAGSAISRFVTGQGGSLAVADFHATLPEAALAILRDAEVVRNNSNSEAQDTISEEKMVDHSAEPAAQADWLATGDGEDGWLAPAVDENPRSPAIRVAVRHRRNQTVRLFVDGEPVEPLTFEGVLRPAQGRFEVSHWRGVPLHGSLTRLRAQIVSAAGEIVSEHERDVHFTTTPARVELVEERSNLVADGRTNPVVAIRVLDAAGRPLREGISGEFSLNSPYESAEQVARQQLDQLTRRGPSAARWTVAGADGVALIELAPTMVSGALLLDFRFDDGEVVREQQLDAWIVPGDIEWTIIGLAEGSLGERSVSDNMERTGRFDSDLGEDARVALYAKGRVLGRFLLTIAYDSAADEDDRRFHGTIDPNAYYTVFADGSSRRYDAASREKLYVRIESEAFFALFGDFETGFDQTRLTRYQRTATGITAEGRTGQVQVRGFGAEIATRFRRDEMQGQGISGPYRLSSRAIRPNSENVVIETRDRFRPEIIVDRRELTRFADYDIDILSGTITFRQPVLSRDFDLNPQFIVIKYEIDGQGERQVNAGLRAEWESDDGAVRIGAAAISDQGDGSRTTIAGMDLRARIDPATEVRAELAASRRDGETSTGWLVEAQHQSGTLDLLAYARSLGEEFGADQQNPVDRGRRRFGADARVRLAEDWSVLASLWEDDSVTDPARRRAAEVELAYSTEQTDLRLGVAHVNDRLPDGTTSNSTVLEGGVTQRMLANKLELSASTSIGLDSVEAVDLPARHRFGLRYAITDEVRAIGLYEIADGEQISAQTVRAGLEVTPWVGGQATASLGEQSIVEQGSRSFAAFGLAQTIQVNTELSLDATFDSNWTLAGTTVSADPVNPLHPLASGGQFGDGSLLEEFTALTVGGAWRRDQWSATVRGEFRDGEFANRRGVTAGLIRQLGEGSMLGSGFSWTDATDFNDQETEILDAAIAMAHRPAESGFAFLGKLEYRSDEVMGAVAGEAGPAGRTALLVDGDARSSRMIASLSTNWSPREFDEQDRDGDGLPDGMAQRTEVGVFLAVRHNFDRFEGYDLGTTSLLAGIDARFGAGENFDIGISTTVRTDVNGGPTSYSVGPQIGYVPTENVLLTLGYNFSGFEDPDFSAARHTDRGVYVGVRMKFDTDSFDFLGLGQ